MLMALQPHSSIVSYKLPECFAQSYTLYAYYDRNLQGNSMRHLTTTQSLFVFPCLSPCLFLFSSFLLFNHSSPTYFSLLQLFLHLCFFSLYYLRTPLQEPVSPSFNSSDFLLQHFQPARRPPSIVLSHYSGNNRLTSLFVSFSIFSLFFFPPFSRCSGLEQAATSSQAHLLARANKTRATFPELNMLLRLSSVNWEFSSLKS